MIEFYPEDIWHSLNSRGYCTTSSGYVPEGFIQENDLLVIRGEIVDGIFMNDSRGRGIVKKFQDKEKQKKKAQD